MIINEPLSFHMMEHLAGSDAAAFCNGYDSYMARELKAGEKCDKADKKKFQ